MAADGYFWGLWKQNIGINQINNPPEVICVGAKWLGEKDVKLYSLWEHGADEMFNAVYDLIEEADAIVGFNHKKFDLPHLNTEFFKRGWDAPAKPTLIDLQQIAKTNFRFISNKLQFISQYAGIGKKIEHEGFELWLKVMDGHVPSQKKMERYCKRDVILTERLYKRMKSYIYNHPAFHRQRHDCGSTHAQSRGYRYTQTMRIQRLQCMKCGGWYDGKKEKLTA
jgi:predicted PolB exonuclease-like 3'-5' exonuclease